MAIGTDAVSLLMLTIESVLLGIFTILFIITMYILIFRRKNSHRLNTPILIVSASMYSVAFTVRHICLNTRRALVAFIDKRDETGGPAAFLAVSTDVYYITKVSLYVLQTIIGDGFLIYRLYNVWSKEKWLLLPGVICLLGILVCGIVAIIDAAYVSASTPIFAPELRHWIVSFFSLTLFTNFSCTALIAYKIWWMQRQMNAFAHSKDLSPVMIIVVESGAVYSAALISLLGTYINGTWAYYFILDSMPQIIGIVFSLIIVRMGLNLSTVETIQRIRRLPVSNRPVDLSQDNEQHVPMHPLVVRIEHSKAVQDDNGKSVSGTPIGDASSMDKREGGKSFDEESE